eukprot:scaffold4624_cov138-Isochrysis_galbana.AAC.5
MPRLPSALGLGGAKRTGSLDWTLNPQEPGWVHAPESSDILRSPENTFPVEVERPSSQLRLPPITDGRRTHDAAKTHRAAAPAPATSTDSDSVKSRSPSVEC